MTMSQVDQEPSQLEPSTQIQVIRASEESVSDKICASDDKKQSTNKSESLESVEKEKTSEQ